MNTEQKFATFFPGASKGRKLGAVFTWLAALLLIVALFVPAFEVKYTDTDTGERYQLTEDDYAEFRDTQSPTGAQQEAVCDILAGKPTSVSSFLTKADKGFADVEVINGVTTEAKNTWVAPVLLGVFAVLVVAAVVTSLFTMNVISLIAVAGAVVELLLVYFLRFAKYLNVAINDYASGAVAYYVPGADASAGMTVAFIVLLVLVIVLQIVAVVLTYAIKSKADEQEFAWDEDSDDRDRQTGILEDGVNLSGDVTGVSDEVVATLVQMNTGKVFMLKNNTETVLGKGSQADIIIPNPIISRTHAKITCSRGVCTLQDLGSKNGTYVGDNKLTSGTSTVLTNGMYITLGNEIFEFNS